MSPTETERACKRFEGIIAKMITSPEGFVISPGPIKASTFIIRFRDAVRGYLRYKHPTSLFTHDALEQVWKNKVVSLQSDNEIYIGPRKKPELLPQSPLGDVKAPFPLWQVNDMVVLQSICTLIHHGYLRGAFIHLAPPLTPEDLNTFLEGYDLAIDSRGNNDYVIL